MNQGIEPKQFFFFKISYIQTTLATSRDPVRKTFCLSRRHQIHEPVLTLVPSGDFLLGKRLDL